ncbi:DNA adenine methylase [Candidatus Fokinia crypta]|uniref:Site-specific DNA-methyltransferase (adenine-specific) n=1 Tax=Candidatus Fokinia crypta TaxID=1920990 RepID=A0ABZ0UPC2_9RICK|nr:DNA adenine methylase [Candidatus Fokinia cryptica]WPX97975.1 DpnA-like adenine-specific methyltransferase [Candidatus Fokinia cryptica]
MKIHKIYTPKPFVKWAGGKRMILNELLATLPKKINNYYEPFIGGGALFFQIYKIAKYSYLSDLNFFLIDTYNTIKNDVTTLIEKLQYHEVNHTREYYYEIRKNFQYSDNLIKHSAEFIYLMKTCYNGLYRVNKDNRFNTPIGNYKKPNICDSTNLVAVAKALKMTDIRCQDFECIKPKKDDFVYFDPPYNPIQNNSFVKYTEHGFHEQEQVRLRDFAVMLGNKGVNVMISNSDTTLIKELYSNFKSRKISAPRMINCKTNGRKSVFEVLITNY